MFERYTEGARTAVFIARFEAIHRRADSICPAHLLLALTWEEGSRANRVGALKDHLADLLPPLELPLRPCSSISYNELVDLRLDQDSKKALVYGAEEANLDQRKVIDTGHLLRGLLRFPNKASEALKIIPLDLAAAQSASRRDFLEFPLRDLTSPRDLIELTYYRTPFWRLLLRLVN